MGFGFLFVQGHGADMQHEMSFMCLMSVACFQAATVVLDGVCSFTLTTEKHLCSHVSDAEVSACQPPVIRKKVGDVVELSSCSSAEEADRAKWLHESKRVTDNIAEEHFKGRQFYNPTNLSLTLRDLTVQDSGVYQFISFRKKEKVQRKTIIVTLQVHGETKTSVVYVKKENTFTIIHLIYLSFVSIFILYLFIF